MSRNRVLVAVPTYNERENIEPLLALFDEVALEVDILFVDDNSPDGTAELIEAIQKVRTNIYLIKRPGKWGIGGAHRVALEYAYDEGYGVCATMDADLTHHPRDLRDMLSYIDSADIVIGSRHLLARSLPGWTRYRKILTWCGHFVTSFFLKIPYDATGGLRAYRLDTIPRQLFQLVRSRGYSFLYESLYILWTNGCQVVEIPIELPARTYGTSKMSWEQIFVSLTRLLLLYTNIRIVPDMYRLKKEALVLDSAGEGSSWDRYWGGNQQERASDILFEVLATWFRMAFNKPFLERIMWKYFERGSKVLHAGCGSGQVDQKLRYWLKITACDLSVDALKMYAQVNSPHCRCERQNILELTYPDETFDGVYNLGVMEHFSVAEIRQALQEFFRVLRPGGHIALFWPPDKSPMGFLLRAFNRFAKKIDAKVGDAPYPPEISRILSKDQGEGLLRDAGFVPVYSELGPRDLFTQYAFVARKPDPLKPQGPLA